MPDNYLGENRFLFLNTRLGENKLLITSFSGREGISELFRYHLDLISEDPRIKFEDIIGQKVTFGLSGEDDSEHRDINGIVISFTQLPSSFRTAHYRAEVAPSIWLLKNRYDCRIFQNLSVPDILTQIFQGIDAEYDIRETYHPREYCVQYRESDFDFASRLMEEEGIFYFFKHSADSHKLVIADSSPAHQDIPGDAKLVFDEIQGGVRDERTVYGWEKTQSISSAKIHLRDYGFKKPAATTDATEPILGSPVQVGTVPHPMASIGNANLEVYDFPGGYSKDGGFDSGIAQHTAKMLAEGLECSQFSIKGESDIPSLVPGYKFTLTRHMNANGQYVLTSVTHHAVEGGFSSGTHESGSSYSNHFTCMPFGLKFRPPNVTPRPRMYGCQTATVTGPSGEEIFTDKYGRIKVHFHWDRLDAMNDKSSCWIRVATDWSGNQWGTIRIPRMGQEVVVDFIEGDPDRPLVVGTVYNEANMPPWALPDNKTQSGVKSKSTLQGDSSNFNQIQFEDKKGSELLAIQAEKDMDLLVKHDRREEIDQDSHLTVKRDLIEEVQRDWSGKYGRDVLSEVARDYNMKVKGKSAVEVTGSHSTKVTGNVAEKFSQAYAMDAGTEIYVKGGMKVVIEAGLGITLKGAGGFINIDASGVTIQGTMVLINSGGAAMAGSAGSIVAPAGVKPPLLPGTGAVAGGAAAAAGGAGGGAGSSGGGGAAGSSSSGSSSAPTHDPNDEKNKEKTHWIELEFLDDSGQPLAGIEYQVTVPDGSINTGTTDEKGVARISNIDPGNCDISFPTLDEEAWEEA